MAYLEKKKKRGKCETVYKRAGNHSNLHLKYFTVTLLSIRLAQRFKERRESNKAALKQPCLCGERIFTLTLRSPFFFPNTKGGGRAELRAFNGVMLPSNGHSFTERRRRFSEDVLSAAQSLLLDPEQSTKGPERDKREGESDGSQTWAPTKLLTGGTTEMDFQLRGKRAVS